MDARDALAWTALRPMRDNGRWARGSHELDHPLRVGVVALVSDEARNPTSQSRSAAAAREEMDEHQRHGSVAFAIE